MAFTINFSEEKNQLLKATRGIGFDEILAAIRNQDLIADLSHPNSKRTNQRLFVVRIKQYAYAVPYVINPSKNEIFLKTVYPSRALTKEYIRGDNHA